MLPEGSMSTSAVKADFIAPDDFDRSANRLIDRELGGIALNDASQGLDYWVWTLQYDVPTGEMRLTNGDNSSTTVLITLPNVTEVALAFDQNMRPAIAYVVDGVTQLRWFDSVSASIVTTPFIGAINPLLSTDEKRTEFVDVSDILLWYIKDNRLCYRMQRERFEIERAAYTLPTPNVNSLLRVGMNRGGRFQVHLRSVN